MKKIYLLTLCALFSIILTGCIKTSTYQVERKDQDLRGNRGIIMGEIPPPEIGRRKTRTMARVDVELPPSKAYKERKEILEERPIREKPVVIEEEIIEEEPIARVEELEEITVEEMAAEEYRPEIKYTVQKGDTLQKISERFYGTTRKWPGIYEANKDTIKHPSKIYPGQVITIPPSVVEEEDIK